MRDAKWTPGTAEHKQYQRAWGRVWRQKNPEVRARQSEAARGWQLKNPLRHALNEYQKRARMKGLAFTLSTDTFNAFVLADCTYCGLKAGPINGIDRIDNSLGYIDGNITTACAQCNYAKNRQSAAQFETWIQRLTNHQMFRARRSA